MLRYLFSIIYGDILKNSLEYELTLMITNDPTPKHVVRFRNNVDAITYVDVDKFDPILIKLLSAKPMFHFRALKNETGLKVLRIYIYTNILHGKDESISINNFNNEQLLCNLIALHKQKIVIEPYHFFNEPQNGVENPLPVIKYNAYSRFVLPSKRNLATEQKYYAQLMADIIQSSHLRKYQCNHYLQISETVVFSFKQNQFNYIKNKPCSFNPKSSVICFTRGCGRKRTISAVLESICAGHFADESEKTFYFRAEKSNLIVCSSDRIVSWKEELSSNCIIIENKLDFDQVTYEILQSGINIIITPNALLLLDSEGLEEQSQIKNLFDVDKRLPTFDSIRCAKFHSSNLSSRFPKAKAPLLFINFRCIIADEIINTDLKIMADWTFITNGFSGPPPTYIDKSLTSDLHVNDSNDVLAYNVWRIMNDQNSGLILTFLLPRVILRKITLIPIPVTISNAEKDYISIIKKLRSSKIELVSNLLLGERQNISQIEISNLLLGIDVFGSQTNASTVINRLTPLSKDECLISCKEHFKEHKSGTVGQRISLTLEPNQLSDSNFVERSLHNTETVCQVCMEDKITCTTLCGHGYCNSCKEMIQVNEIEKGMINCPVCRATLTVYDWFVFGESGVQPKFLPSKVVQIIMTISQILSKRRIKKRLPLKAILIAPKLTCTSLISSLKNDVFDIYDSTVDLESRSQKPYIRVLSSDDIKSEIICDESTEAIILACPLTATIYYQIIRANLKRVSSIQLFVLYTRNYENIETTIKTLLPNE